MVGHITRREAINLLLAGGFASLADFMRSDLDFLISRIGCESDDRSHLCYPVDAEFENLFRAQISEFRQEKKIPEPITDHWALLDITQRKQMLSIGMEDQVPAASLIKLPIALGVYHIISESLEYNDIIEREMRLMLYRSDNVSANWLLGEIGGPSKLQEIIDGYSDIFEGTKIGGYIPLTRRDLRRVNRQRRKDLKIDELQRGEHPKDYYSSLTTMEDMQRLLLGIYENKLPGSLEILKFISIGKKDRFVSVLDPYYRRIIVRTEIPPDTKTASKSGSSLRICADVGIIYPADFDPYIFCGAIVSPDRRETRESFNHLGDWLDIGRKALRQGSEYAYLEMKKRNFEGI